MKNYIIIALKFALAGGTIWAIGMWVLTSSPTSDAPTGEVKNAEADIAALVGLDGNEFTRAMAASGLKPRPYDLNGNVMYFAAGKTDKKPREALSYFQKKFVDYGVNEERHDDIVTPTRATETIDFTDEEGGQQRHQDALIPFARATMSGDVVPTIVRDEYVQMSGIQFDVDHEDQTELAEFLEPKHGNKFDFASKVEGYQYVDATWEPGSEKSQLTAVWTDKEFDGKKMDNTSYTPQEADPNIPACPGCERDFRFQSLDEDEPYRSNAWRSRASVRTTYDFYKTQMASRGWTDSGVQSALDKLAPHIPELDAINGRLLHLEKDGKNMQVAIIPDGQGGAQIMSQERYEDGVAVIVNDD